MAKPKGEHGDCRICGKQIGAGTRYACFYHYEREPGLIVYRLVCKDCY